MKKYLAVILAGVTAVAALAGCAVLYQTDAKYETALQNVAETLDGVRSENAALKEEIAAAQKTLADLQTAQEERVAALEVQKQKEQQLQKQQEIAEVAPNPSKPSGSGGGSQDSWNGIPAGQDPFGNKPNQGGTYIDGSNGDWK